MKTIYKFVLKAPAKQTLVPKKPYCLAGSLEVIFFNSRLLLKRSIKYTSCTKHNSVNYQITRISNVKPANFYSFQNASFRDNLNLGCPKLCSWGAYFSITR